jgi:Rod binding domain-containing protein
MTISAPAAGVPPAAPQKTEANTILAAARQFEALLIGQMLEAAKGPDGEGLLGSDGGAGSSLIALGQQQFAEALASNGGLGIAKMVIAGLEKHAGPGLEKYASPGFEKHASPGLEKHASR